MTLWLEDHKLGIKAFRSFRYKICISYAYMDREWNGTHHIDSIDKEKLVYNYLNILYVNLLGYVLLLVGRSIATGSLSEDIEINSSYSTLFVIFRKFIWVVNIFLTFLQMSIDLYFLLFIFLLIVNIVFIVFLIWVVHSFGFLSLSIHLH